ncbi:MAG: hypothetical protein EWV52_20310 [Microcystis panniformis Mp_MB_F_20051200_S6D]|nr:MAG: hypothetical protein EWV43_14845 [Microcystis panniformis Mp_MB_F_20080800_S26D]TRV50017.1 MAG: hypothetical protein EWV42_11940 [Microcystis panniformis Mp_GB_SS_20050300_S99D]TRV53802.1 MAG: hypothetical protein EWV87_02000 [Microcystis panniformis Mp_GB_SS_20050300_S99]TRV66772.1 MAG: hypothetical protein EWV86_05780 [Microcystis panniformis Mp_MB_F_20051200_S9D]TRV68730.1 MAG: hypothetical protein EWV52_20310 [Microcystis panniformis Mp_MB_F_20051200_S6D]TRV81634.1 MAG: hypothetica
MKAIILSLLFLGALPPVALSLDSRTQEILEERTCRYLKSGWTLGETARAIRYAVEQNSSSYSDLELINILRDRLNDERTKKILVNAKKRCPEFFSRN